MKVMLNFFVALLSAVACFAQGSDPAAKKILDQASAKIKSYKSIQVSFHFPGAGCPGSIPGNKKRHLEYEGKQICGADYRSGDFLRWKNDLDL